MTNTNMNKELKAYFDSLDFVSNPDKDKYYSLLGDDTDTLFGCNYLNDISGIKINGFFDFENLYVPKGFKSDGKKFIGIDMSLITGRCWDNHMQAFNENDTINEQMANINAFYKHHAGTQHDYHKKYAGSTFLQMYAYYDGSKPLTKEGQMLLLAVDSAFKGHYDSRFKDLHNSYLEDLGLTWAIDLLDKFEGNKEWYEFINTYGLNSKLKMKDGKLQNVGKWSKSKSGIWTQGKSLDIDFCNQHLGFEVSIPQDDFIMGKEMKRDSKRLDEIDFDKIDKSKIVSLAFTYANQVEYTSFEETIYS